MRTGFPCNESRFFPVGIDLQGFPVSYTGFGFTVNSIFLEVGEETKLLPDSAFINLEIIKLQPLTHLD